MKILMINPHLLYSTNESLIHPPLGIGMLSAFLKINGHHLDFLDMPIEDIDENNLASELVKYDPDIIGVTVLTETYKTALSVAKICKTTFKTIPIVFGGPHVSFAPKETLERNPFIDYVVRYEGELTLLNLINSIERKEELSKIGNIGFRNGNDIVITNEEMPIENINSLPFTDRTIFNLKKYLKRDYETIVLSARGCPGKCSFCASSAMGRKHRYFSINRLLDEIEECMSYGFKSFFIADDTFAFNNQRLSDFSKEKEKRGLNFKWTSNIRIIDINEEKARLLKESGAYRVFVGVETINDNSSKIINKNINTFKIINALEILNKFKIESHASFIIGAPGDTEDTLDKTSRFISEINPTIITLNSIRLYPGTDLYINAKKHGITLKDKYWYENDEWVNKSVCGTTDLPPEKIDFWMDKIYMDFLSSKFK